MEYKRLGNYIRYMGKKTKRQLSRVTGMNYETIRNIAKKLP